MAKKKTWVEQLLSEQYFVWAILFVLVVSGGLLGQISIATVQLDTEASYGSYLTVPHTTKASARIHRNR